MCQAAALILTPQSYGQIIGPSSRSLLSTETGSGVSGYRLSLHLLIENVLAGDAGWIESGTFFIPSMSELHHGATGSGCSQRCKVT